MIEIKGLESIQKKLARLQNLGIKTKPLMQTLGNILQNEIEDSFENEISPFGHKWEALKPSTIEQKLKTGKSERILRKDGNLADKWIVKAKNGSVSISNNSSKNGFAYGLTHQFGSSKAGRNRALKIPARPFLPIDKNGKLPERTKNNIKDAVEGFIESKLV